MQIVDAVIVFPHELDNSQDKIIGFVEGVEDFVTGDGKSLGAGDTAFVSGLPDN